MALPRYDQFLADVLCKEKAAFGFAAHPAYGADLPAELVWLLIRALIRKKELTLNQAARVVLDFTERNGKNIPYWLEGRRTLDDFEVDREEAKPPPRYLH